MALLMREREKFLALPAAATDRLTIIAEDKALSIAKKAQDLSAKHGFIGDYRFLKKKKMKRYNNCYFRTHKIAL